MTVLLRPIVPAGGAVCLWKHACPLIPSQYTVGRFPSLIFTPFNVTLSLLTQGAMKRCKKEIRERRHRGNKYLTNGTRIPSQVSVKVNNRCGICREWVPQVIHLQPRVVRRPPQRKCVLTDASKEHLPFECP